MSRRAILEAAVFVALFGSVASFAIPQQPTVMATQGWQYLDLEVLRSHLLRGLLNQHSQPPLLNLLLGLALKVAGEYYGIVLRLYGLTAVLVSFVLLGRVLGRLGLPTWWRYPILCLPQVLIFASWFYEPIYCFTFLILMFYGVLLLPGARGFFYICSSSALLSLTHTTFHPGLVLLFSAGIFVVSGVARQGREARPWLIASALVLAIPCAFLAKNVVRFSVPALSSWSGCNLSQTTTTNTNFDLSIGGLVDDASRPEIELYRARKTSGFENYNNISMIDVCRDYLRVAVTTVKAQPWDFLDRRIRAIVQGEASRISTEYFYLAGTRSPFGEALFWPFLAVQRAFRGIPLLIFNQVVPLMCFCYLLRRHANSASGRAAVLLIALYFLHTVIIYFTNANEQSRMQFKFLPLLLIASLLVGRECMAVARVWYERMKEPT